MERLPEMNKDQRESADSSATSYGEPNLYTLKSNSDVTRISNQVSNSDRKFKCGPESYCQEIHTQQYSNSSSKGFPGEQLMMASSGSSITMQNPYNSCSPVIIYSHPASFANTTHSSSPLSEYLDRGSPDHLMDYGEDEIRSKIQELERELLNDNDDVLFDPDQDMTIDNEWVEPIKNLLLANSPKESFSSNSNGSSISSKKETPMRPMSTPRAPKQLLFECAAAIAEGNVEEASTLITKLRQIVSIQGCCHFAAPCAVEGWQHSVPKTFSTPEQT
ncbi:hypothetical protein MRB53_034012 [Persea americana]|uniref:Uncharacterized protein n=1 Tax=Persea americana TaxID=3435 RepID=A0ACC2KW94_PERAE|nr:hypothetical protein MRB53_034012 [Persea americana]